jgi:hypothetical protein
MPPAPPTQTRSQAQAGTGPINRYWGKYRGRVESNIDEELMGRIQVSCPAVMGLRLGWAMPCVPYAGPGVGWFAIPPIGADVWVEFEGGDPNYPIWAGCFWQPGQIPIPPGDPNTKCFVTTATRMVMNDLIEEGGGWSVLVNLAAAAVATAEEAQSAAAVGEDAALAAADAALALTPALGGLAASEAMTAADDAAGDAVTAESDAEWVALEAETAEDEVAEEAGEVPGVYSIVINLTGITIAAPIAEIKMTPETIIMTVPESVMTMTSADITITVPESVITLTPAEIVATCPPGTVAIGPEAVVISIADTNAAFSEASIGIEAPNTSVTGLFEVEGNASFTPAVEIEGNLSVLGDLEVNGANVEIAALAIELTAAETNVIGAMTVEGDILMDGQQVLVI